MTVGDIFKPMTKLAIGMRLKEPNGPVYILCAVGPFKIGLIDIISGVRYSNPGNSRGGVIDTECFTNVGALEALNLMGSNWQNWEIVSSN